jgi:histidinol-phosphate aminotransferase
MKSREEFIAATVRPEVRAMRAYPVAPPWPGIKLELMEDTHLDPHLPAPELRRELGERIAEAAFNRYPDPAAPALKDMMRKTLGIDEKYDIMLGAGSDEIITIVSQSILAGGGTVVSLEPSFSVFKNATTAVAGRYVGVSLRSDFTLDIELLLATIEREQPKLVWIVYPNNPTGNLFPEEDIERVIGVAPGLVVIDEAYEAFAGRSWLARLDEFPNVVLMRTLSKIGLAGIRLGYAIGAPEWINEFNKVRGPFNVGVLQQVATVVMLKHFDTLKRHARMMIEQRDRMFSALKSMPGVTPFPSVANFVLARFPDSAKVFDGLKARGILVRNLSALHPHMANTLRLSAGTPSEVEALLVALDEIL